MACLYRPDCDTYRWHVAHTLFLLTRALLHGVEAWYTVSNTTDELKSGVTKQLSKAHAIRAFVCCSSHTLVERLAEHNATVRASIFEVAFVTLDLSSLSHKLSEKYRVYIPQS